MPSASRIPRIPRSLRTPRLVVTALLAAGAVACGKDAAAPADARFHVDLLAGTWASVAACPFEGPTYDFAFNAPDSAGVDSVTGRLQSHACSSYTAEFPSITGRVSRAGAVTIESEGLCCASPLEDYRYRFTGKFVDSTTMRGSIARWAGDRRLDAPVALTLTHRAAR